MSAIRFDDPSASEIWGRVRVSMKARRREFGLSLRVFAGQLNVTATQLCRLEKGTCAPTINTFIRWCRLLDMNIFVAPKERRARIRAPRNIERLAA